MKTELQSTQPKPIITGTSINKDRPRDFTSKCSLREVVSVFQCLFLLLFPRLYGYACVYFLKVFVCSLVLKPWKISAKLLLFSALSP